MLLTKVLGDPSRQGRQSGLRSLELFTRCLRVLPVEECAGKLRMEWEDRAARETLCVEILTKPPPWKEKSALPWPPRGHHRDAVCRTQSQVTS